jgi:hypothetical protein
MSFIIVILCLPAAAALFAAVRYGASKYFLLICGMLSLAGCLSFTTTERPAPVSTVTRTETVYVTDNGTRVRRVVTVDASAAGITLNTAVRYTSITTNIESQWFL